MQSLTPFFVLTLIFSGGTLFYLARLSDCRDDQSARKWGPDRFQVSDRFFQEGTGHPGELSTKDNLHVEHIKMLPVHLLLQRRIGRF